MKRLRKEPETEFEENNIQSIHDIDLKKCTSGRTIL